MHEYGPVITTFIVVLAGVLFNRKDVSDLKADIQRQFSELKADMNRRLDKVDSRLDRIDSDLKEFHGKDRELEAVWMNYPHA